MGSLYILLQWKMLEQRQNLTWWWGNREDGKSRLWKVDKTAKRIASRLSQDYQEKIPDFRLAWPCRGCYEAFSDSEKSGLRIGNDCIKKCPEISTNSTFQANQLASTLRNLVLIVLTNCILSCHQIIPHQFLHCIHKLCAQLMWAELNWCEQNHKQSPSEEVWLSVDCSQS